MINIIASSKSFEISMTVPSEMEDRTTEAILKKAIDSYCEKQYGRSANCACNIKLGRVYIADALAARGIQFNIVRENNVCRVIKREWDIKF